MRGAGSMMRLGQLPVAPPFAPMLAKRVDALPDGEGWLFEPKWDGFRVLVFRDGDELLIQSRDLKPLDRYFPELVAPLKRQLPQRCVVDGELVIVRDGRLDFEALQSRLHPAASRVTLLSSQIPASLVFWDLVCVDDRDLRATAFRDRRALLAARLRRWRSDKPTRECTFAQLEVVPPHELGAIFGNRR